MTKDDMAKDIGQAFIERRELVKKIDCLEHRLRTTGKAAVTLADNPVHQESESALESASDVREDFAELKRGLTRLRELNRLLND